jgi:predicted nucleotidyltransferase
MGAERNQADAFTKKLQSVFGDALVSVVLYGSAARGDYREGVSDLNLLVVLRSTDAAALRLASPLAREWSEKGNPPPLVLGEAEWRDSADVFPIEYMDMRDAHLLLHGADPFAGLDIQWRDLRLQCEHELKSKQIRLREHYLLVAESSEELGKLLTHSFPTFLTLFRTALRLARQEVPRAPEAVITAVSTLAGFDPEPFRAVQRAREAKTAFLPPPANGVVTGYLESVERITRWLDHLTEALPAGGGA